MHFISTQGHTLLLPVLWNRQNQLGYKPTDFVAPHRLGLVTSLDAYHNPNLTFHNGNTMYDLAPKPLKTKIAVGINNKLKLFKSIESFHF